jgi:GT2 family glycosyltransferase
LSNADITVIIPTWNQRSLLEECLSSLARQTAPCSVTVVDNGSTDGTVQMVQQKFPHFECLELSKNFGFAKAVNLGIEAAETRYIALLNNDATVDPHWIEVGLGAFKNHPDYGFFASKMVNMKDRSRLDSAGDCYGRTGLAYKRGFGDPVQRYSKPESVLGASAGAAFYRRELFTRIGLFDESYYLYLEDVDLSLRAQLHGFKCYYLPEAIAYHLEGASDPEHSARAIERPGHGFYSRNRVFWITRNRWQLMVTYQPLRHLPWLLYGWLRSFAFHLLKAGHSASFLHGLGAGVRLTVQAFRKRSGLNKTRVLKQRELCHLLKKC